MVTAHAVLTPPTSTSGLAGRHADAIRQLEDTIGSVVRGKAGTIRQAVITLLARGHLLVEDVPGVGKTTLARALAAAVGGTFRRVQFTSDLLPSDIVGVSIFDQKSGAFSFHRGPIFANVVLADEINRTTPRTQSALLEAMSEGHVSVDDVTYQLEQPFMVIATQNPTEHYGTYPLPESQLDRFLLRIEIGYPSKAIERDLLRERDGGDPVAKISATAGLATIRELQVAVEQVVVDEAIIDYAMTIVEATRAHAQVTVGVSTRGALAWFRAAQANATVQGRSFCTPDDFKELAPCALAHRLMLRSNEDPTQAQRTCERIIGEILERTAVPT